MAFVLEELTDEQRIANGLALNSEVAGLNQRRGLKLVHVWAIDRERDVYLVATRNRDSWYIELHWQNNTINLKSTVIVGTDIPKDIRAQEEGRTKKHLRVFFKIYELIIPENLKDSLSEIKELIKDGLAIYAWGSLKYAEVGYAEFSPNLEIRFPKITKSEIKLSDFATIQ